MTLEEAIKHCQEAAERNRSDAEVFKIDGCDYLEPNQTIEDAINDCLECAREHEELAAWLSHYKKIREIINDWSCDLWSINGTRTQKPDSYYFQKIIETFEKRGNRNDDISGDDSAQPEN